MPLSVIFACELCTAASVITPVNEGEIDIPTGWLMLTAGTADLILPPHLDAFAAAAEPEDGPALDAEKEPFRTKLYVCPDCRPSIAPIDDIVRARFKARDEVEQPEPPTDGRVIDLNTRKKK